ncbi:hypothetical protein BDA99DRAFT_534550 [Phascolomyces articulosus]|uniref:Uncharacterized protein n=1 Tax=Phascolomyces articulosus TaxID=60185 RepID=A0AAD5KGN3_9FUNG|nr:hypothetical protein BDA99DRAFT_534550 [Phascolomyces articulosus]
MTFIPTADVDKEEEEQEEEQTRRFDILGITECIALLFEVNISSFVLYNWHLRIKLYLHESIYGSGKITVSIGYFPGDMVFLCSALENMQSNGYCQNIHFVVFLSGVMVNSIYIRYGIGPK